MVRINKKRLNNHPDAKYVSLYGDICYIELGIVYAKHEKGKIVPIVKNSYQVNNGALYLTGTGLVLAISEESSMYKNGIRVGDTIIISKDVELNDNLTLDSQPVNNPFSALYSFKTIEQLNEYKKIINCGNTCIIDGFKCIGKLEIDAPEEDYTPIIETNIIVPDVKIIN